jgi:glycosyltransferase involved in cell wall biosynthesis
LPSDRPRIGYVMKVYPRFSETFIVNEVLAHERAGAELELFSLRPPTGGRFHPDIGEVRAPVTYVPVPESRGSSLWPLLRAAGPQAAWLLEDPDARDHRDVARARGVEHLHAHFASLAATVTRLAARLAGVTYSVTAHAKDIFHEDVDEQGLALRLGDASTVITVSDFNLEHLLRAVPGAPVHRVYNGLDLRRFAHRPGPREPDRIIAVGRLVEKKGFADLVAACALLAGAGRDVRCDLVGEGACEGELRALIAEHGLGDRVRLLGPRTQAEVRELVRGAACMAAPCVVGEDGNRDGLPTVLIEAMAIGTPVVSTAVTGIPELVRHEQTGLIAEQHDPASLAAALARVLDDPAQAARLAATGRALVEREFDVDRSAARLRRLAWPAAARQPAALAGAR